MSIQTPESITRVLLAALNAADDIANCNSDPMGAMSAEAASVATALAELVKVQVSETIDDRQNRFAATVCASMNRLRSAS